jgi:hypothetical protein
VLDRVCLRTACVLLHTVYANTLILTAITLYCAALLCCVTLLQQELAAAKQQFKALTDMVEAGVGMFNVAKAHVKAYMLNLKAKNEEALDEVYSTRV